MVIFAWIGERIAQIGRDGDGIPGFKNARIRTENARISICRKMLSTLKGWATRLLPLAPHSPMNRPIQAKVSSTGIQLLPAEALAREVAEECKRADQTLKDAFRFHDSRLFPEKIRNGGQGSNALVNQLAPTYFEERDGDVKTWAPGHASAFFAQWKPRAHRPGVPGGMVEVLLLLMMQAIRMPLPNESSQALVAHS